MWRIHGVDYDLRGLSRVHPGGSVAIDLVQGMDATDLFEQFHVRNEKHRALLSKYSVTQRAAAPVSAFHDDVKAMVREHFGTTSHKASPAHRWQMVVLCLAYASCWVGWWRGSIFVGGFCLPVVAWLVMTNASHDASHFAFSTTPLLNEAWLLAASPLLYSCASWYVQHCVSHHLHTNDPDNDADLQHHPFAKWHAKVDRRTTPAKNLAWHATAYLVATLNMSLVHPWKFVVVPLAKTILLGHPPFDDQTTKHHEAAFFRAADLVHRSGFFAKRPHRLVFALAAWVASLLFLVTPHLRFDLPRALALSLLPYALTSLVFMLVTQISHVQLACQRPNKSHDFFQRQAATSLDYATQSHLWRVLTGGLNLQSIHHVLPGVSSCHYTDLYPKFYKICQDHGCAPAIKPNILAALKSHLSHVADLGGGCAAE